MADKKTLQFAHFNRLFSPDDWARGPLSVADAQLAAQNLEPVPQAYTEFLSSTAHSSYCGGLLRFLLPGTLPSLVDWNSATGWSAAWPQYQGLLRVFAYDWLGRQFAFHASRRERGEPLIAMLEPGTGALLEIPRTFFSFIEEELIQFQDAALASGAFRAWKTAGGASPKQDECVGYRVPLFLGGQDEIENMEIYDLDVYITMMGQLVRSAS